MFLRVYTGRRDMYIVMYVLLCILLCMHWCMCVVVRVLTVFMCMWQRELERKCKLPEYHSLKHKKVGEAAINQEEYRVKLKENQDRINAAVARRPSLIDRHDEVWAIRVMLYTPLAHPFLCSSIYCTVYTSPQLLYISSHTSIIYTQIIPTV